MFGQGHRLGTSNEKSYTDTAPKAAKSDKPTRIQEPVVEDNLTEEEREQKRAERAAAAEARLKKQGTYPTKKKKKQNDGPLVGPNSKPLMTWTAG